MTDPLRAAIEEAFHIEREGWAAERVTRVTQRLDSNFETLVFWHDHFQAFTAPGNTIYFSRRMLERMPDDDAAAMVIAHEIAHHRLGHVPQVPRLISKAPITVVVALLERWIAGAQHEMDADLVGIEMCLDAGYDLDRCVHALEQLAMDQLDYGDIDGVLGREDGVRSRSNHPHTDARIAAVRQHAARVRQGFRIQIDVEARRRERRRRIALTAGAGAAAVALLVLRRRLP